MSRGWTYQEGLLSKRRIFFAKEQVYFECDARHCFESTGPSFDEVVWESSQKSRVFAIRGKAIRGADFYKTINEYSGRTFTYESDILNGVWGVLRTFRERAHPVRHYWGIPLFSTPSSDDCISGFAWDLLKPAQRRVGFPSWSWTGWLGQVKPGLLVKAGHPVKVEHASTPSQLPSSNASNPAKSPSRNHIVNPSIPPLPTPESNRILTPDAIPQNNLPNPVTENIFIHARRMDGSLLYYQAAVSQYSRRGGQGLSHFLHIKSWIAPATFSTFGHPMVTISRAPRDGSSLNDGLHYK